MQATARFLSQVPGLMGKTALALVVTAIALPVSISVCRKSYRRLRQAFPRHGQNPELAQAIGVCLSALGVGLPLSAARNVYRDWEDAIDNLRHSQF